MNLPLEWPLIDSFPPEPAPPAVPPWEDGSLPALPALLATLSAIIRHPRRFFRDLPLQGGQTAPLAFALLIGSLGMLGYCYWQLVGTLAGDNDGLSWLAQLGIDASQVSFALAAAAILLIPLYLIVKQYVQSWMLLGALRLLGGQDCTFAAAFRLRAYAQAPMVAALIPLVGILLAVLGNLIIQVKALSVALHFSTLRALAAVLLMFLLEMAFFGLLAVFAALVLLGLGLTLLLP